MKTDLNPEALLAFEAMVRVGSFTAAALELQCAKSHISQLIRQLEDNLGTVLLIRNTRRLSLTEAGQRLLPHAIALRELLSHVRPDVEDVQELIEGALRVSTTPSLAQYVLAPLLAEFALRYPQLRVRLDALSRIQDPVLEGIDFCLRVGLIGNDQLVAHSVGYAIERLYASSAYLDTHPAIHSPADLSAHETLVSDDYQASQQWLLHRDGAQERVPLKPRLYSDNNPTLAMASVSGHGISLLPHIVGESYCRLGLLQPVLPDWHGASTPVYLVFPYRQPQPRKYREFIDFMLPRMSSMLFHSPQPTAAIAQI